jgi:hypothetical protein
MAAAEGKLKMALSAPPVEIDLKKLKAAIGACKTAGCPAAAVAEAEKVLSEATALQNAKAAAAKRCDQAIARLAKASAGEPLDVKLGELEAAVAEAQKVVDDPETGDEAPRARSQLSSAQATLDGARQAQERRSDAEAKLASASKAAKAELEVGPLRSSIEAAREAGVDAALLSTAEAVVGEVEAAIAAQLAAAEAKLAELAAGEPLSVDAAALSSAIAAAKTVGVPQAAVAAGEAALQAAKKAVQEKQEREAKEAKEKAEKEAGEARKREALAAATKKLQAATAAEPLDVAALKTEIEAARKAGVGVDVLQAAEKKMNEAVAAKAKRDADAAKALADASAALQAATAPPLLEIDLAALRAAIEAAQRAGAAAGSVEAAEAKHKEAKEAQEAAAQKRREELTAQLQELTAPKPLEVDLEALGRAVADATSAGVDADVVRAADEKLKFSTAAIAERDAAVAALSSQIQSMVDDRKLPRVRIDVGVRRLLFVDGVKFNAKKKKEEFADALDTDDYIDQVVAAMCLMNRLRQLEGRKPIRLLVRGRAPKNDVALALLRAKKCLDEVRSKYEMSGTDEESGTCLMTGDVAPTAVFKGIGAAEEPPGLGRRPSLTDQMVGVKRDDNEVVFQVLDSEPWPEGAE